MKNQREIYEALLAGEVLVCSGKKIYMQQSGMLNIKDWAFSFPAHWSIQKPTKSVEFFECVVKYDSGRYEIEWINESAMDESDTKTGRTRTLEVGE